jgi:hypothetical protein
MPQSDLRDEMKASVEPLLPVEKRLIGWSLGLGLALLEFELSGEGTCNISTAGAGAKRVRSRRQIKQEAFIK